MLVAEEAVEIWLLRRQSKSIRETRALYGAGVLFFKSQGEQSAEMLTHSQANRV